MGNVSKPIVVAGSIAIDRIFDYPGRFRTMFDPEKLHVLSVSFAVDTVQETRGGAGANIAYTLGLLRARPVLVGAAGSDWEQYRRWLTRHGVDTQCVAVHSRARTASAYIMTDRDDNQLSVFHTGALSRGITRTAVHTRHALARAGYAIIAPDAPTTMMAIAQACIRAHVPYLFDPGQQLTALTPRHLVEILRHADGLIVNDFERSLIEKRVGKHFSVHARTLRYRVTTHGPRGSVIETGGSAIAIPAVRVQRVVDPTGAGDAYRAGFLAGISSGLPFEVAGRLGSLTSSHAVSHQGTQSHVFTRSSIKQQYARHFKISLPHSF